MAESAEVLKEQFLLDPSVVFLNHGSFGACPKPVFAEYQRLQLEMERQPVEFLQRRLHPLLEGSRNALGAYLKVPGQDLVLIDNATWGVNVIARSMRFEPGDELLTTDHEYGACTMTWEWLLGKAGGRVVRHQVPLPVTTPEEFVESFWTSVTPRTRVIFMSHITAPTALIFPVAEICRRAREAGILTVIDGAHVPGQLPLDLAAIGADAYAGNLHKWLCAPKGAGFLHVRPEHHEWVESLIVSWGWGIDGDIVESTFVQRNEWQGTRDYAAYLSVPAAIEFQAAHDWTAVRARCHELASATRREISNLTDLPPICPDVPAWFGQLVSCPIQTADPLTLKTRLYDEFKIEVPMVQWQGRQFVRVSFQGYNTADDGRRLVEALQRLI